MEGNRFSFDRLIKRFEAWFRTQKYAGPTEFEDSTDDFLKLENDGVPVSKNMLQNFRRALAKRRGVARTKAAEARKAARQRDAEEQAARKREPEFDF